MRESKRLKIRLADFWLRVLHGRAASSADKRQQLSEKKFRSILIYSTTALGDYMFNTPALRAIRQHYPTAHITLVAHPKYTQLLESREFYDSVIFWNNKVSTLPAFVKAAKVFSPELAVMLHSHVPYDILSAGMIGCEYLIRDNYSKSIGIMSRWLVYGLDELDVHIIRRKMQLVSELGCDISNSDMAVPCTYTTHPKDSSTKRIGFQLGASEKIRCWPPVFFSALAEKISKKYPNTEIVLIGSQAETELAHQVIQSAAPGVKGIIHNYVGKTTLPELLGIIDSMDVLVTGDTGPLHLAIALKTPTLSLFVTANPNYTGPYQDPHLHTCIYLPADDKRVTDNEEPLRAITVEEVYQELINTLEVKSI